MSQTSITLIFQVVKKSLSFFDGLMKVLSQAHRQLKNQNSLNSQCLLKLEIIRLILLLTKSTFHMVRTILHIHIGEQNTKNSCLKGECMSVSVCV